MSSMDKESSIPLYLQLKRIIEEHIEQGRYQPNEKIPSENELSASHNISRMTVRHAIKELVSEGYLYVRKGEGTFVKHVDNTQMLIKLDGFSREMSKLGFSPSSKVLRVSRISILKKYQAAYLGLRLSHTSPALLIERIRYLNNTPFAIETTFLDWRLGAELLNRELDPLFSIYSFLEKEQGLRLQRAEHSIEPQLLRAREAKLLKIKPGQPVLCIRGATYSTTGRPVEYLEGIYRGDKYQLKIGITK